MDTVAVRAQYWIRLLSERDTVAVRAQYLNGCCQSAILDELCMKPVTALVLLEWLLSERKLDELYKAGHSPGLA